MTVRDAELNTMFMQLCRSFASDYAWLVTFLANADNMHTTEVMDMLATVRQNTAIVLPTDEAVIRIGHAMGNAAQAMMLPFEFDVNPITDVTACGRYDVLIKKANAIIAMMSDVSATMNEYVVMH